MDELTVNVPNLHIGNYMFADMPNLSKLTLKSPNLTSGANMFIRDTSLTGKDLYVDTRNNSTAWGMFNGCSNLNIYHILKCTKSTDTPGINYWDCSNLRNIENMFVGCKYEYDPVLMMPHSLNLNLTTKFPQLL